MELSGRGCFTPAEDAQAVDHGGVRVGSHHAVGVDQTVADLHHPGQILQIHLVDCTDVRRNHVHVLKCFWTPLFGKHNKNVNIQQKKNLRKEKLTDFLNLTSDSFHLLKSNRRASLGQTNLLMSEVCVFHQHEHYKNHSLVP